MSYKITVIFRRGEEKIEDNFPYMDSFDVTDGNLIMKNFRRTVIIPFEGIFWMEAVDLNKEDD